ncbi:MAG: maltokinase N-terminal cap-like domain-containing protein [Terriglobales bacterium]
MGGGEASGGQLPGHLARALPTYLPPRRWFADKNRAIEAVRLVDFAWLTPPSGDGAAGLALALAHVDLSGGGAATYLTPATWSVVPPVEPIAEVLDGGHGWLGDALSAPGFAAACLAALRAGRRMSGAHGVFVFQPSATLERDFPALDALAAGTARLSRAEQSNSTVLYADASGATRLLLKCFRRLGPGLNPDAEVTGYLTAHGGAQLVPPLAGTVEYQPGNGNAAGGAATPARWTLGIFQAFIANDGDGWEWVLRELRAAADDRGKAAGTLPAIADLGRRTAEMHRVLAAAPEPLAAFAPEPIRREDWAAWQQAVAASAVELAAELARRPPPPGPGAEAVGVGARRLARLDFGPRPQGLAKIRVHGDFHLGQALRTRDGDWRLFDFEGEPARPLAERRQKLCALKDVAGMLRSLDYAAGAAAPEGPARIPAWLDAWREEARRSFQVAYFEQLGDAAGSRLRLAPTGEAERATALNFFELEKAVYEVGYELRHRPDWLALPLAGLTRLTERARR